MERNKQNLRQKTSIKRIYDPVKKKDTTQKDEIAELFRKSQEEIFQGNETMYIELENNVNTWYYLISTLLQNILKLNKYKNSLKISLIKKQLE